MRTATFEKAAADTGAPHPLVAAHKGREAMIDAFGQHERAKKAYDEAHRLFSRAHDDLRLRLRTLEGYFQKAAIDRLPFHVVDDAMGTYYGADGKALMDLLATSFPREKRAADTRTLWDWPLNRRQEPFSFGKAAIEAAKEIGRTKAAMDAAWVEVEKAAGALRPFVPSPRQTSPSRDLSLNLFEKDAAGLVDATKGLLSQALGMVTSPAEKLSPQALKSQAKEDVDDEWLDLEDPEHENKLRAIRAQTMLHGMMTDPESPVSGYDPERVFNAYDELAQNIPRGADRPAVVQPLLAKRLAGNVEPFEVKEMLDIEKGIKDTQNLQTPSTRLLADAPTEILG